MSLTLIFMKKDEPQEPVDTIWQCSCGCVDMRLKESGEIYCYSCEKVLNATWKWNEA